MIGTLIRGRHSRARHAGLVVPRPPALTAVLALSLLLVACAPSGAPSSPPLASGSPTASEIWRTTELRDVRTGETFRISELGARVVVLEPMAIWCANCRIQQNEVQQALGNLAEEDIAYISLDVDPNETEEDLARYADEAGFGWHFVVASRDVSRSLAQTFGDQVLSPPSTPAIVVAPDGSAQVQFGIRRAGELEAEFSQLLR